MKHNLKIADLSCTLGNTLILHNLSFTLEEGGIWAIMGPSGSGKTTLLRSIAGFETQLQGTIHFGETQMHGPSFSQPTEKRGIGFVFQDYALFPHLTVQKNIEFGLKHLSKLEKQKRVLECLNLVNLAEYAHRYPHQLSGGQQQRVALARSVAPYPKILLLDEPFSHLDQSLRLELKRALFTWLRSKSIMVLWVTHDQKEALSVADGVLFLDSGTLLGQGTPFNLYYHPPTRQIAEFLGEVLWVDAEHPLWNHPYFSTQTNSQSKLLVETGKHRESDDQKNASSFLGIRPHFWSILPLDISYSEEPKETQASNVLELQGMIKQVDFEGASSLILVQTDYEQIPFVCHVYTSSPLHWKPDQKVIIQLKASPFRLFH